MIRQARTHAIRTPVMPRASRSGMRFRSGFASDFRVMGQSYSDWQAPDRQAPARPPARGIDTVWRRRAPGFRAAGFVRPGASRQAEESPVRPRSGWTRPIFLLHILDCTAACMHHSGGLRRSGVPDGRSDEGGWHGAGRRFPAAWLRPARAGGDPARRRLGPSVAT